MTVTRLSLSDFRSYADAVLAPGVGLVVLTGENGAGKTNVLEAVSLLSPGRGLRGASLSEIARSGGSGGFGVAARLIIPLPARREGAPQAPLPEYREGLGVGTSIEGGASPETYPPPTPPCVQGGEVETAPPLGSGSEVEIGTGTLASAPERRQVRINGAAASANSLGEWLSVLWLTPAMDRLFQEGASGRRRFLDRLVLALSPAHAVHAARYEAAMRARNKLLAEEGAPDEAWLSALEARMVEHGAALAQARTACVAALAERLAAAPEGPFARAGLALAGGDEDLGTGLARSRSRDAAAGRTLIGPHRTDLAVTHLGKGQPAALCSTGEQKALLLAIILAHADLVAERAGRRPILLLDEVAAHLDARRRAALFARLDAGGGQVWMTGTEAGLFEGARASWWHIADGTLVAGR